MKKFTFIVLFTTTMLSCNNKELQISKPLEEQLYTEMLRNGKVTQSDYEVETYIDTNMQNTSKTVLHSFLKSHNLDKGYVIVMETQTGKIKAMTHFERTEGNDYFNSNPLDINNAIEPGGLIKVFDMMTLYEDDKMDTSKKYATNGGTMFFEGMMMKDKTFSKECLSLTEAFLTSNNTVFAQVISNEYKNAPLQFLSYFDKFGLNNTLNYALPLGTIKPRLSHPDSTSWGKVTLPWMAIGYEMRYTPFQLISYYNAIGNNGKMMQPLYISKIKSKQGLENKYSEKVIKHSIASEKTITTIQNLLKKYVSEVGFFDSKIDASGCSASTTTFLKDSNRTKQYGSSFIGYFPSNKPKYTLMVYLQEKKEFESAIKGSLIEELVAKFK